MAREQILAAIVSAAGGEIVGRVRFQKAIYLMEQMGLGGGFEFSYHHYGPYSREIDEAMSEAKDLNLVVEDFRTRAGDGARYSVFISNQVPAAEHNFGMLGTDAAAELLDRFARTNVTVLELAATADWLWRHERRADWKEEIVRRKGAKTGGGRIEKAISFLREIGLPPPESAKATA